MALSLQLPPPPLSPSSLLYCWSCSQETGRCVLHTPPATITYNQQTSVTHLQHRCTCSPRGCPGRRSECSSTLCSHVQLTQCACSSRVTEDDKDAAVSQTSSPCVWRRGSQMFQTVPASTLPPSLCIPQPSNEAPELPRRRPIRGGLRRDEQRRQPLSGAGTDVGGRGLI